MPYKKSVATSILTSSNKFHINLGLKRVQEALLKYGNPQDSLNFIHVAGTNGKGSTCSILNSILIENFKGNKKIGFFSSPHLFSYCERIKIDNKNISQEDLDFYVDKISSENPELTEFEILTVVAFLYFKNNNVDYIILETGLGGLFDSTNVIKNPLLSIITTIDFDHTARLGDTIDEIAYQKAGITKKGSSVVVSKNNLGLDIIKKYAKDIGAKCVECPDDIDVEFANGKNYALVNGKKIEFNLLGDFQKYNLSLALCAISHLPFKVHDKAIELGLKNVKWPARLEYDPNKNLIIDGAHNESGIKVLVQFLNKYFKDTKKTVIFGCLDNKDYKKMLTSLNLNNSKIYFYEFNYPSSLKYNAIKEDFLNIDKIDNPKEIIDKDTTLKIVCGSLYMIQELFDAR